MRALEIQRRKYISLQLQLVQLLLHASAVIGGCTSGCELHEQLLQLAVRSEMELKCKNSSHVHPSMCKSD
jgi:hypothetical protein